MRWQGRKRTHYLLAVAALAACGGARAHGSAEGCPGGKVWHADDAKRFRGCTRVHGDLALGGALVSLEDFSELSHVTGSLSVGPSYQLTDLSALGGLEVVGEDLVVSENWRASGLFLGALHTVGGGVRIHHNGVLATVALHRLQTFAALEIAFNSELERVDLSGLPESGPAGKVSGPRLESVLAPERIDRTPKAPTETPAKGS